MPLSRHNIHFNATQGITRHNRVYSSLLEAAGDTFRLMSFMMYNGRALIATMTATFHPKVSVTTKDKSE